MMYLIKRMAILCTLLTTLIIGTLVIGGRLNPDWSSDFGPLDWCGGKLCFMKITPGVTSWDDARRIVEPYGYQNLPGNIDAIEGVTKRVHFLLVKSHDKDTVSWLWIDYAGFPHGATIKSVIARFGPPCRLNVTDDASEILTFVYPALRVGLPDLIGPVPSWVVDNSYSTDVPIQITVNDDENACNPFFVWKGFRSYSYYDSDPHIGYEPYGKSL